MVEKILFKMQTRPNFIYGLCKTLQSQGKREMDADPDDEAKFPFTHLHRRLVKEKIIPLHNHHNAPGYPQLSEDEMAVVKYDLQKACEALGIVKKKYQMDEKIELMINNWIRGIQETKRTSKTYYELFGHLFALHEKYNDIVSSYMTQSNTMAAPWFEYFWRKMDFIRLDLSGCMKDPEEAYKYTGLNWLSKRPSNNSTDRDPTFRPNRAALEHIVDLPVYTCGICGEGLIGFSPDELDKNGRQKPIFYPCSAIDLGQTEYTCSEQCGIIRHSKEKSKLSSQKLKVADPHPSWKVCQMCYKQTKLFLCSACKSAKYCSRRCQIENWDDHKETCLKLQKKEKGK